MVIVGDQPSSTPSNPAARSKSSSTVTGPPSTSWTRTSANATPAKRAALEQLRAGRVADAVDWYREHDRIATSPTRDEALEAAVDGWEADLRAGHEAILLAWRRRDVAALNQRARQRRLAAGAIEGPGIEASGGKRYAGGDRVVTLAPAEDGRFLTSERGTVCIAADRLTVRFDDGRTEVLTSDEFASDRLDHSYAVTVHRMQGATVDRTHVFADGVGRELIYVAMSRARETSHVYAAADDLDRAVDDPTVEWSAECRQRWVLDVDEPALDDRARRPNLATRTESTLRLARLRAERDAVQAVAPEADARLRSLEIQLRLEQVAQRPPPGRSLGPG